MLFGNRNSFNLHSLFPTGRFERKVFNGAKKIGVFNLVPKSLRDRKEKKLKAQVAQLMERRYAESNLQIGQLVGIDLSTYGYDV